MLDRKSTGTKDPGAPVRKEAETCEGSRSAAENPDLVQTDGKAAGKERKHICSRKMEVNTECRKSFGAVQR